MTVWVVHSEWLPLPGSHSPDRLESTLEDQAAAERFALQTACCRGARYVTVQGPDSVVTLEWDRYTNVARRYARSSVLQAAVRQVLGCGWDGELVAQSLYARVAEYHGYTTAYRDLPVEDQARWYRAGVAALEQFTDHIITAGRPVWWMRE